MQGFEVNHFLSNNEWVSVAEISASGADAGEGLIQLEVSAAGHRLICERGLDGFSQKIHEKLPSTYARTDCWNIRPLNDLILKGNAIVPHFELPHVLSWINEAPRHALLLEVSPDLRVFEGHFPGNPILPGIVQLHWAVGVSMGLFSIDGAPSEIKRLKFKNIVQPPRVIELVLTRTATNEIQFQFSSTGDVHSMGCFVIEEEPPC